MSRVRFFVAWSALFALASLLGAPRTRAQDLDLRWDDETVGPVRDPEGAGAENPDAEPDETFVEAEEDPDLHEGATPPPPEPTPRTRRATPISPVEPEVSYRGQRVPNLFAFFQAGARTGAGLGGRASPHLALGAYSQRVAWGLAFGNDARSRIRIDFDNAYVLGAIAEYYPRGGAFQLRAGLAAALVHLRRAEQDDFGETIRTRLSARMLPNASLGFGAQWRPSDAFGRFRLGLLFETGASTMSYRGDRLLFMDFSLSTTITWF